MDDIWYVDDDPVQRVIAKRILEQLYVLRCFGDGAEAYAAFQQGERPKLLITDLNMPVMKGPELIKRARAMHPDLQCILLSGGETGDLEQYANDLHVPFCLKPYAIADFKALVQKCYPG
jgi:CheY-like chemotaxis protein